MAAKRSRTSASSAEQRSEHEESRVETLERESFDGSANGPQIDRSAVVLDDEGAFPPPSTPDYDRPDGGEGEPQTGRRKRRRRRRNGGGSNRRQDGGGGGRQQRGGQHQQNRPRSRDRWPRPVSQNGDEVTGTIEGVLELHPKGYGFLRDPSKNYAAQETDAFVSSSLIEKHNLREGILIRGDVGPGSKGQGPRLKSIESVDGRTLEEYAKIKVFEELTPINPFEQVKLETGPRPVTMRVMDLLTPIGKGQRALIVAPPRTGKTMLLQDIADSVSANHPELHLIVLLIDERPEEVTEMRRRVKGEVIASSMDRDVESHVRISQLIIERGKRLAEAGGEVFILLDSITRTARAFNKWVGNSGRTATGGLDIRALDIPKKLFGTARRFDEGGSLTVTATALIDTGSRMDESIFQEFKGTGNMELVLSRELADRRIWPAIDITLSGTRREEKILPPDVLEGVTMLRRSLISLNPVEAMEQLIRTLERFPTNAEFLAKVRSIL
jgi:transcription termination factor Rho